MAAPPLIYVLNGCNLKLLDGGGPGRGHELALDAAARL
jgi:hypothetical protein